MVSISILLTLGPLATAGEVLGERDGGGELDAAVEIGPWEPSPEGVVGGTPVPEGRWDDAVGVVFEGQYVGCTGTLVAPDVVLTAEHCADSFISHVLIGSKNWLTDEGIEIIAVERVHRWPGGWTSPTGYDVAALELREPSSVTPRMIATECIIDDYLEDGVEVHVVGFGSTDAAGGGFNVLLNEGLTVVQTADCDVDTIDGIFTGCKPALRPGGEIGAGGNGVDACFGDSGGPLYLPTPEGTFLVGVTSRAYLGVSQAFPCRDGGIYVRPDAIIDWVEESVGKTLPTHNCNQPPRVEVPPIETRRGKTAFVLPEVIDDGAGWTAEVVEPPLHGRAWVGEGGEIVYEPSGDYQGEDDFVVAFTDEALPEYPRSRPQTVEVTVPVVVRNILGCSCGHTTGGAGGAGALLLAFGWLGLRRRTTG